MSEDYREKKFKGFVCTPPARYKTNKKDTRRWCKGVVGREHVKEWKSFADIPHADRIVNGEHVFNDWFELVCTVCGKEFDCCYFTEWRRKRFTCKCGKHAPDGRLVGEETP